jgi:chemotaxis signal transduction protein
MSEQPVNDCWNRIGVRGDVSCPELRQHVHCHNCPVHATAALALLDREPPAGTHAAWTAHFAEPPAVRAAEIVPLFVFRVGEDWLATPAGLVAEVAPERTVHSLPHRRRGALLGLVNVHGSLVVCLSLAHVLGLEAAAASDEPRPFARGRMLLIRHGDVRAACPVDEVNGIQRVEPSALVDTPAVVAGARACVTRVWMRRDDTVGVLDETLFGQALRRSLA